MVSAAILASRSARVTTYTISTTGRSCSISRSSSRLSWRFRGAITRGIEKLYIVYYILASAIRSMQYTIYNMQFEMENMAEPYELTIAEARAQLDRGEITITWHPNRNQGCHFNRGPHDHLRLEDA